MSQDKIKSPAAILIVVGKFPRGPKLKNLTQHWADEEWERLSQELQLSQSPRNFIAEKRIVIIPDFDKNEENLKTEMHRNIRMIFKQRQIHAFGAPIALVNSFAKDGPADQALQRSFSVFLSLYGDAGKAFMIYEDELR